MTRIDRINDKERITDEEEGLMTRIEGLMTRIGRINDED